MEKVDLKAIAKAEQALEALSSNFDDWIVVELTKLGDARKALPNNDMSGAEGKGLFHHAHDLKGLGTTYGYPIVTAFASSLCDIIGEAEIRAKAPITLVDAHIDSIRAAIKGSIKVTDHPVGKILSAELAKKTKQFLATI
ncbi:MAG: Hpt domain-containing protein [Robiginitomaculum sp.]|nr:Hpt domain-containing protein [Robiginitomaculum sp.]